MTVSSQNYRNDNAGGGTGTFPYLFRVFQAADLKVVVTDAVGVETVLTLNTHYSVTGAGTYAGGNVILTAGYSWMSGTNLAATYKIVALRNLIPTQPTDLRNQSEQRNETIEDSLDLLTMLQQQQIGAVGRSLRQPDGEAESVALTVLPPLADRKGKGLAFDSNGVPIASPGTSSAPASTLGAALIGQTTAAGMRSTIGVGTKTVSTSAPSGVPNDGDEWIQVP